MKKAAYSEPGSEEWHKKTIGKLLALIRNSKSGRTFVKNFETDKEHLTQTELDVLLRYAIENVSYVPLKVVLEAGANPNITLDIILEAGNNDEKDKMPLLHYCCYMDDVDMVSFLLNAGADPLLRDKKGRFAEEYTQDKNIRMLLETARVMRKENKISTASNLSDYDYDL